MLRIVEGGEAIAVADVTVDGQSSMANNDPTDTTTLDAVSNAKVLAGSLVSGPIAAVRETTDGGAPLLAPGHYLVFLADRVGDQAGVYYLAAGPTGSFEYTDSTNVTPMCAKVQGYPDNGSAEPMQVSAQTLTDLASQAITSLLVPTSTSS